MKRDDLEFLFSSSNVTANAGISVLLVISYGFHARVLLSFFKLQVRRNMYI